MSSDTGGVPPLTLPPAPIYRQDEYVREPTRWTDPMRAVTAAYLVVIVVINVINLTVFAQASKDELIAVARLNPQVPADRIDDVVNQEVLVGTVFACIFGVLYLVLAGLTYFRRLRWVLWVDMILIASSAASGLVGLTTVIALRIPLSSGQLLIRTVLSLLAGAIVIWMLVGLIRYGPWALRKVPARLET